MKQKFVFFICLLVGSLWGLSFDWSDSISLKLLIGGLYGAAIGILAYNDKCNLTVMYLVSGLSALLFSVGGIIVFVASSAANLGSFLIMSFIIPAVLFWGCTRTQ